MKHAITSLKALFCAATLLLPIHSIAQDAPKLGNIRVVIGSTSTGGDTYQASSIISDALSKKLNANFKVDAVGTSEAFRTLRRVNNGSVVMIFHDQAYLGYLYGTKGYYNIFEEFTVGPTFAINPGNAYLVPKNSKLNNVDDVINAVGNGKTLRVAIQPGGVSEIGYTALKNAIKLKYPGKEDNLVAVNTGSQSDKNQQLFDGQADIIQGSIQANEQYTRLPDNDQKAMKFIWITAKKNTFLQADEKGLGATKRDEFLSYVEPNAIVPMADGENFTFDKEFFFLYNKKMDPAVIKAIDDALADIKKDPAIAETFKKSFFIPAISLSQESLKHIESNNKKYEALFKTIL